MPNTLGQYKGIDITPGTQEQIQAQINNIDGNAPINSAALAPTTPLNIPPVTQPTGLASFQGQMEALTKSLSSNTANSKAKRDASGKMLAEAMFSSQGEAALTDALYGAPGGVDETSAELDDINQQLLQEQEGLRREIEAIQDNAEGLTRSGVAGRIDEARRKSLRTQADLSVVQMAKQGRFNSAKAIADRAIAVQLEKQKQNIDNLRFMYEENKDEFTKAEQREFEFNQAERKRELENEEYRLRAEFDQKIAQNDPLYKLQIEKIQKELSLMGQPTAKELKEQAEALKQAEASIPVMRDKLTVINTLKTHPGMAGTVGAYGLARWTPFSPDKDKRIEFIGGVEKLVGGLTLDNLIAAKERGATFGALSIPELQMLANSASSINNYALKDSNGKVYGYEVSEASFVKELETIETLTKRALIQSGQSLFDDDEQAALDQAFNELTPTNPSIYFNNAGSTSSQ